MRIPFQGAALALACAAVLPAFAQTAGFGFDPYVTLPGVPVGMLAVGDVDGNRRDDLVTLGSATPGGDGVRIFAQQPDGTLGAAQDVAYARPLQGAPSSLLLVDLDGDGTSEIVVGYTRDLQGQPGSGFAILHRNGAGGYAMQSYAQGERNIQMAATDVDRDGNADIVTLSQNEGLRIHYGDGTGGIRNSAGVAPALWNVEARELRIGDVNGDGADDIVVNFSQATQAAEFAVHRHNGIGGLLAPVTYTAADNTSIEDSLAVGDFTGDGRADVAIAGHQSPPDLWLFAQNAVGGLANLPAAIVTDSGRGIMAAVDLDRDGYTDLVKMHGDMARRLGYYLGSPAGLLAEQLVGPLAPALHYRPGNAAFGDLNGDGCTDAVVSNDYTQVTGGSLQSVDLLTGHGCGPNADLAATVESAGGTGEVIAGIEHHGGITLDEAHAVVSLRVASGSRVVAPAECVAQPGRLLPIRKPQPTSYLFNCTVGNLALGERREFIFSLPGEPLSAGVTVYSDDTYDPKSDNNDASIVN